MTGPLRDVPERWPVARSVDLHRDGWVVALRADFIDMPGSQEPVRRLVLEHPGAVVVLAVDDAGRAYCLWQYRHPGGRRFLELPAGLIDGDADEEPVEVARRELREEAELRADRWTHLTSVHCSPGISAEVHHLYLATGLSPSPRGEFELHHEELDMTAGWVPVDDLHAAAVAGELTDGPTVLAVLLARARGLI